MRRWSYLLGGLLVWSAHFAGVYAIGSLAAIRPIEEDMAWRAVLLVFSVVCAGLAGLLALRAGLLSAVGAPSERFTSRVAALGAAVSVVAIAFQTLPALLS